MTASVVETFRDVDEPRKENGKEGPLSTTGGRNLGALASFVGNQLLQRMKRRQSAVKRNNSVDALRFQEVEEDEDIFAEVGSLPFPAFRRFGSDEPRSLKSPRRLLQSRIPNGASQQLRMDLILLSERPDRDDLKKNVWKGCSAANRAQVWRLLVGYEPFDYAERKQTLAEKREKYQQYLTLLKAPNGPVSLSCSEYHKFSSSTDVNSEADERKMSISGPERDSANEEFERIAYSSLSGRILRQIEMDLPRTHPDVPIFHVDEVRNAMRRILYVFGILNPNNNYVQGMNEILTPILVIFFSDYLKETTERGVESFLKRKSLHGMLSDQELEEAEADAFWTFTCIVSFIKDNFVSDQPGILRRVARLEEIVRRVDPTLSAHLARNGNEFIQFSFRWMNCLLMRELPFNLVIRVWDAFLAEEDGISDLHVYFCAAMLTNFSTELLKMDFEDSILFLQHLPTVGWDVREIDVLMSQAQLWKQSLQLDSLATGVEGFH